MKELSTGDFYREGVEPREVMLEIALQAQQVVIAQEQELTNWWLFEDGPVTVAYFGTPETLKKWKLQGVQ